MQTATSYIGTIHHVTPIHVCPPLSPSEPVSKKLDRLAFTRDGILSLEAQRSAIVETALSEVRSILDSLDSAITDMRACAEATEMEIKEVVLIGAASVKGTSLQAVYNRGRISYDTKGLDALAVIVPEVLRFRKEGEPSVSIREVKH